MKNHNEKIARAAHIKPRTEGTSNEISLSVLGAASQGVDVSPSRHKGRKSLRKRDDKKQEKSDFAFDVSRETSKAKVRKHTSSGAEMQDLGAEKSDCKEPEERVVALGYEEKRQLWQDTPSRAGYQGNRIRPTMPRASVEEEVQRRKRARKRNKIILVGSVSAAIAVALIGIAWIWHMQVTEQQGYEAMLVDALRQINEADDVVMKLDDIMNDPFSSDSAGKRTEVIEAADRTRQVLNDAEKTAEVPSENLLDGQARQAANECIASINARQTMLSKGTELLTASEEAISGTNDYNSAWQIVLEADTLAKDASKLTSSDEVEESEAKYQESLARFQDAKSKMSEVQTKHPQVQLADVISYLDKRIESMGYAIDSNNALIDKDKEEAVAKNDAYNDAETQAANLALKLPAHPAELYQAAYSESNAATINSYKAARSQAGSSDTVIRAYLGADE